MSRVGDNKPERESSWETKRTSLDLMKLSGLRAGPSGATEWNRWSSWSCEHWVEESKAARIIKANAAIRDNNIKKRNSHRLCRIEENE